MYPILNLLVRFRVFLVTVLVCVTDVEVCRGGIGAEAEDWGRSRQETVLDGLYSAVDYCVDGIYYVVDEGLWGVNCGVAMSY